MADKSRERRPNKLIFDGIRKRAGVGFRNLRKSLFRNQDSPFLLKRPFQEPKAGEGEKPTKKKIIMQHRAITVIFLFCTIYNYYNNIRMLLTRLLASEMRELTKTKISDFKMLEKPPYTKPIPKNSIEIMIKGVIENEKTYGPIFTVLYIKNALRFAAQKFGETPKEAIKTLDQLIEYLVSVSDKHPDATNAVVYTGLKTTSDLEGQSGAGARVGVIGFSKNVGKESSVKERNVDIDQLLATIQKTFIQIGLAQYEVGYRKNEDESVDIIWPNCYMKDGCRLAHEEGATRRIIGGMQCASGSGMCQILKLLSGFDWDYELLEFDKPHCIARCYMI